MRLGRHNLVISLERSRRLPGPPVPRAGGALRLWFLLLAAALLVVPAARSLAQTEPVEIDDAISRLIALYNDPWFGPVPLEVISSREISIYNDPLVGNQAPLDVWSREITLHNDPAASGVAITDVWSREVSTHNDPQSSGVAILSVVSREVTCNNDPSLMVPTEDIVSREVSVLNDPVDTEPPDTTITSGPAQGSLVCPGEITFGFSGADALAPVYMLEYRWRLDGGAWSEPTQEVSVVLPGVGPGQHVFEVQALDPDGNADPTPALRAFTLDNVPPSISGASCSAGSTTAVVTWTTNEPATSRVLYGTTEALGSQTPVNPNQVTSHSVTISGLEPETRYYCRAVSADRCGQATESATLTFTTLSLTLPPRIAPISDASLNEGASYAGPVPQLLQGDPPVTWALEAGPPAMTVDPATGQVSWPYATGSDSPWTVTVRAANSAGSDTESWQLTVQPAYTASVSTETTVAPAGSPVTLCGSATQIPGGAPAANVPVSIVLQVKGIKRTLSAQTNSAGEFCAVFSPLPGEAGHYLVGAKHPGVVADPVQDEFILVGMETAPASLTAVLVPGVEVSGEVDLLNLGDTPLTGITAGVEILPPGVSVTAIAPPSLDASASAKVTYTLLATGAAWSGTLPLRVTSAEGAVTELQLHLAVRPPVPELTIDPALVSAGMVRGNQSFVQFQVANTGGAVSGDIPVSIPSTPWLSLASPAVIGPLAPGEAATVVLSLTPAEDLELGLYTGSIAVGSGSPYGKLVPYSFTCLSDGVGDLRVIAEDEFTYHAPGNPPVTGAAAILLNPITGQVVAEGVTGTDGVALFQSLAEAYYTLRVTADKHNAYEGSVRVTSGETTEVRAFLPRQLVTYNFRVSPVVVEDRYDIRLEAVFETNVPAPVVTVEPGLVDLRGFATPRQHVFVISNRGLVRANNVRFRWSNGNNIAIHPLSTSLGDLDGGGSVAAPVGFDPDDGSAGPGTGGGGPGGGGQDSGGCSRARLWLEYDLVCGVPRAYTVSVELLQDGQDCPGASILPGGEGGDGGGFSPVAFGPVISQPVVCDPCDMERLKVLLGCIIDFIPIQPCISAALGVRDCWNCAWSTTDDRVVCALDCYSAMLNAADCAGAEIPYIGHVLTATKCLYNLYNACDGLPGHDQAAAMASDGGVALADSAVSTVEYVRVHADRLQAVSDAYQELLGKAVWLEGTPAGASAMGAWLAAFEAARQPGSESGQSLSEAETAQLVSERPPWVEDADASAFAARWNRTLDYWQQGIFDEADLPAGYNSDFIALDRLRAKWDAADAALRASLAEGFDSVFGGAKHAADVLRYEIDGTRPDGSGGAVEEGICARVRLRIDQRAVISRSAFQATLELNNAGDAALEGIAVNLVVRDQDNNNAAALFSLSDPVLEGVTGVDGAGTLAAGTSGTAGWTIIPTDDAAPEGQTIYTVGGTLEYTLNGAVFVIPLYPARITVLPNPSLHLNYFWQHDVYSDDPFTPEIEPAEPFTLGLILENRGAGAAGNVRITTSQPEIVDNEKGLVIDFTIIGTQVNAEQVSPSLNVSLGDVEPGKTGVARWLMTSTLQGKFVGYEASYEHLNGLGDTRLSLIDSVNIHELIHAVRVEVPEDDVRPDFLVNDIPDLDHMPETVYGSDASVTPVALAGGVVTDGPVTPSHRQIALTCAAPQGFMYLRTPDPGEEQYRLMRVMRSDGHEVRLDDNAWTTHRTIRLQGQPPRREHLLHLFDHGSTGAYTLYYEPVTAQTVLPGEARMKPDGESVEIGAASGVIVTGVFADGIYVSAPDRSSGIRVTGQTAVEGDRVAISGAMSTAPNGERVISATSIAKLGTGAVDPLSLSLRSLYGGDFHYDAVTGAGQKGMKGGAGLNAVGLLVRAAGRVTAGGVLRFTLSEQAGVRPVAVQLPLGVDPPALESIVAVTGLLSCEKQGEDLLPVLRVRRASDIVAVTVGPVISGLSISSISITSATVSWNTDVPSTTEVRLGAAPGEYDRTLTSDGLSSAHSVVVDALTPGSLYYLVAVSRDPVTGITTISPEQSFRAVGWGDVSGARRLADGADVETAALIVTACFEDFFYVQRPDRAGGGLRVAWSASVAPGRAVALTGMMDTTPDGERILSAFEVQDVGEFPVSPVLVTGMSLGGGPFFYDALAHSGQMGVDVHEYRVTEALPWRLLPMAGLNNIGLLVRAAGTVHNAQAGHFYLDDGSAYGDAAARGIKVSLPAGASSPPEGTLAVVTGISSLYRGADGVYRLLLVSRAEDIAP